jgi:hypothetical protein
MCLRGPARGTRPRGSIVERTGVDGESVTIRDSAGVTACDSVRSGSARWCGSSFGRLYGDHLRDPRLDIGGCTRRGDTSIAFAWVEPDHGARYIAVEGDGYAEVYQPAAGLPVRISTRDVSDGTGATFHVTEHDARGGLLRRFELQVVPAG